jgi:hypothetical protein
VILIAQWVGRPGPPLSRALQLDKTGELMGLIWEGDEAAITAAYAGRNHLVLGCGQTRVYDRRRQLVQVLEGEQPAGRLLLSDDERWLMELKPNEINIWDLTNREFINCFAGMWTDACISPDGSLILATGFEGKLFCLDPGAISTQFEQVNTGDLVQNISMDDGNFVASFLTGDPVRTGIITTKKG